MRKNSVRVIIKVNGQTMYNLDFIEAKAMIEMQGGDCIVADRLKIPAGSSVQIEWHDYEFRYYQDDV